MNAAPDRRWFCYSHSKLFALSCLFVVLGISLALWIAGPPLSWIYDYDKERYTQIETAIKADAYYHDGKPLDEVIKQLNLEDVPWDEGASQNYTARIYHFRGFSLYLDLWPHGANTKCLDCRYPSVMIDGISDPAERMKRHWKFINEDIDRINAEMRKGR
jgi:hypothetical protein